MPTPPTTRRGFLGLLTWFLGGVLAALAALPGVGALLSPLVRPRARGEAAMVAVASVNELSVGVPRRVELKGSTVDAWARQDGILLGAAWLVRQPDGTVTAFSSVCPHLGCAVNLHPDAKFACPCHTSAFALDGRVLDGPAPRPLDSLTTEVRGGKVLLRYARFKVGQAVKEEA